MVLNEVSTICGLPGNIGFRDGDDATAQFNRPSGVAVDREGNLIVADTKNNRIRKVSPDGVVSTLAGDGTQGFKDGRGIHVQFNFHYSTVRVAFDDDGNVFISDIYNHAIRKMTPNGTVSTVSGAGIEGYRDGPADSALFSHPQGVALDHQGNLFVSDCGNRCIRKITKDGVVSTVAGRVGVEGYADGRGSEALFKSPRVFFVDSNGFIYVVDIGNHCLRRISPDGDVTTVAGNGTPGDALGPAHSACLKGPMDCAVDGGGNVIISDSVNHRILKLSEDGVVSCLAGNGNNGFQNGPGVQAQFNLPFGVAVDQQGNVIVCDGSNHCLRRIAAGLTPPKSISKTTPTGSNQSKQEQLEGLQSFLSYMESQISNPEFSDVKVHVDGDTFHAHAVLLSRSPFFKAALTHQLLEGSQREVTLTDMNARIFRRVLEYLYTGKCDLDGDLLELLEAAEFLGLLDLKTTCESVTLNKVDVGNAIRCFRCAEKYALEALKRRCVCVASESGSALTSVMLTSDYVDFVQSDPGLHQEFVEACKSRM